MVENIRRFELLFDGVKNRSGKWRALVAEKRKVVRAALVEAGCDEVPRNLRKVAERLAVADVRETPLSIRGRLVRQGDNLAIEINSDLSHFEKRQVLAHELAHILLEDGNFELSQRERSNQSGDFSYRVLEKLCDECAAEMLVPVLWLRDRLRRSRPSLEGVEQLARDADCSPELVAERVRAEAIWQCTFLICEVNEKGAWIVRSYPAVAADSLFLETPEKKESSPIVRCATQRRRCTGSELLRFGDEVVVEKVECVPLEKSIVLAMLDREAVRT